MSAKPISRKAVPALAIAMALLAAMLAWCVPKAYAEPGNNQPYIERSWQDGVYGYTHRRLRKAKRSISRLVAQGTLFTYLDPELTREGPLPSTNNRIEGGVNAQLRALLRNHRGMSLVRRVKAVFWWCYMHTENPAPAKEILDSMPTDDDSNLLYRTYSGHPEREDGGPEWGDGVVWEELHHRTPYPYVDY